MKVLTTAKTIIINALLAVAVMVPAAQAQAGWKGELAKIKEKYKVTVTFNRGGATIRAHKRVTKPILGLWRSNLGKISFPAGYYSRTKKLADGGYIKGQLIKMRDGRYAFVGKFGKGGKSDHVGRKLRSGKVKFVFSHNGKSFKGYYVSSKTGQKKAWNGSNLY